MRVPVLTVLGIVLALTAASAEPATVETSFEGVDRGPATRWEADGFRWNAPEGAAEIHEYGRTGRNGLHLFGGEDRTVEFTPPPGEYCRLSFWAERWTSAAPFRFRVEAMSGTEWREVYNGDAEVRVGRAFLSHVEVDLTGSAFERLRFVTTAPETAGVLVDDLVLARPVKMTIDSVTATQQQTPVLIRNESNPILEVAVRAEGVLEPVTLKSLRINLEGTTDLGDIDRVEVFSSPVGRDANASNRFGVALKPARVLTFTGNHELHSGDNVFWVSCTLKDDAGLLDSIDAGCDNIVVSGPEGTEELRPDVTAPPVVKRIGIALRKAGDDGSQAYRIPGLATTNKGTLIAVYDIRYRGGGDLPGHINIGMNRSTNGGDSWSPMKVIMDMGDHENWNGNGIGDPAVLVDRETNTIWVAALWSHGNRGWHGSGPGLEPEETGQFMLSRSDDDGLTWSEPINITKQVKKPEWRLMLQGPGNGITLRDGTLVFPAQFRDAEGLPHSTIIWSKDRGKTWTAGTGAKGDTTESQVVELDDGSLMLNMRDNRGGSRSVAITRDLGLTWTEHPTTRKALPEPVCMASLIRFSSVKDGDDRSMLLFSNPNSTRGRHHITIKMSLDEGETWPEEHQKLLDELSGAGYSCMTKIDDQTVGILYEGSQAHLVFEKLRIDEIRAD